MSQSIVIPIILHFLNNFFAIIAFSIFGEKELMQSNFVDVEGINTHIISFSLLVVLFIAFIIFIKRNYFKLTNNEVQNDLS